MMDIVKPPTKDFYESILRTANNLKAQEVGLDPESITIEVTQE